LSDRATSNDCFIIAFLKYVCVSKRYDTFNCLVPIEFVAVKKVQNILTGQLNYQTDQLWQRGDATFWHLLSSFKHLRLNEHLWEVESGCYDEGKHMETEC